MGACFGAIRSGLPAFGAENRDPWGRWVCRGPIFMPAAGEKCKKGLDFHQSSAIIVTVLLWDNNCIDRRIRRTAMEKSPSWSRAHDWKSCRPLKGLEGSNPSFSAMSEQVAYRLLRLFSSVHMRLFRCSLSQTAAALPGCSLVFGISIPETQFYLPAPRRGGSAPASESRPLGGIFCFPPVPARGPIPVQQSPGAHGSRGPLFRFFRVCMSRGKPTDSGDSWNGQVLLTCTASGTR